MQALTRRVAELEAFDVVAHSGGVTVVIAFLAEGGGRERIRSLTLVEPPWVGLDFWSDTVRRFVEEFDRLVMLDPVACWDAFRELYVPGVDLPAPADLQRVPLGLRTCWAGYRSKPLDRGVLRAVDVPVYLPVGGRSSPRMTAVAHLLAGVFPRACVEVFPDRHHFDLLYAAAAGVAEGVRRSFA